MAYDPTVPPSLIGQGIGGTEGLRHFAFMWVDPITIVLNPGYISNAVDLGMRPGDSLIYKDVNRGEWDEYHLIVDSVDDLGAGTLKFPEVPEEALELSTTFDDADPSTYLVIYQDGRQVRIPANLFAPDGSTVATQAQAEAGLDNTARMTPLRTAQAIAAQFLSNLTARLAGLGTKGTPVNADGVVIVDSADSSNPKRVTIANFMASVWARLGSLIAGGTEKTTPDDADKVAIADSANSNASRFMTLANIRDWILTYVPGGGADPFAVKAMGELYFADFGETGVAIPPSAIVAGNTWVELTAGLTGVGQFNNGKLTGESVTGSAPNVSATANVAIVGSPMNGSNIELLNTTRRFMRPGSPGTREANQNLSHGHPGSTADSAGGHTHTGPYGVAGGGSSPTTVVGTPSNTFTTSTAGAHTHTLTIAANGGTEARPNNIGVRIFRKVG